MQATYAPKLRPAFTIIEILISVIILSGPILYVLKMHTSNHEEIVYITERNQRTLSDSLYLSKEVFKYHKSTKSAYDLLENEIRVKERQSQEVLKKESRDIFLPQAIMLAPPSEIGGPASIIQEVDLKGKHAASYWHFEINL